ncbi:MULTISPECIES: TRAP transporter small permease [unclassified Halomonas]|uniref:TRAP transporter small permease n=1 Tax=unclassified Halomonas TaxID=2609666 RepID=UPI001CF20AD8|nr:MULTISPECIES: TRAP transporter small permease [unclassified Halomonas]MCA8864327.1 TRAP transporter small permease [Halomonas sp. SBBP1]UZH10058.1 TRAP transporter small permease [Halomonas sp. BDJS001]
MSKAVDLIFRAVDVALVALLAGMTAMVFLNVVLRYGFGSGIDVSDELSRFFFVWLIFLGAVAAMHRNMHIGFDLAIMLAPVPLRRAMLALANGLIVAVCALLMTGSIQQFNINATNIAPVTRLPMIWVFGAVIPMSGVIGLIAALRMVGYASGRLTHLPRAGEVAS